MLSVLNISFSPLLYYCTFLLVFLSFQFSVCARFFVRLSLCIHLCHLSMFSVPTCLFVSSSVCLCLFLKCPHLSICSSFVSVFLAFSMSFVCLFVSSVCLFLKCYLSQFVCLSVCLSCSFLTVTCPQLRNIAHFASCLAATLLRNFFPKIPPKNIFCWCLKIFDKFR